jgi:tRNA1(Val) A37 N6-methylase TrmN6
MKIERKWAMPNKWTFTIKPIADLLKEEVTTGLWCDPFAGMNSPAQITNDIRPSMPTTHHMPALDFLKSFPNSHFDGVLYDPPYSPRQVKECYDSAELAEWGLKWDGRTTFWSETMDEVSRILKPNGKLICCGWTSMGGSMSRGFEMQRILLVPHGGRKNDTIVTVELKTAML